MDQLRVSAKKLAELAIPDACPRCRWVKIQCRHKIPFEIFPAVFGYLDRIVKRKTESYYARHGVLPAWLGELAKGATWLEPPTHHSFNYLDESTQITLSGEADLLLGTSDGGHLIIDYKTAFADGDSLLPLYQVQLNAYAKIGEKKGLKPKGLALLYCEPDCSEAAIVDDDHHSDSGFLVGFKTKIVSLPVDTATIPIYLQQYREIVEQEECPAGKPGCKNCGLIDKFWDVISLGNAQEVASAIASRRAPASFWAKNFGTMC